MARNKKWSSALKFEIVLLALKGETTLNEICKRYEVAPSQVQTWKKQFLEQGQQLFDNKSDKKAEEAFIDFERKKSQLYEKIGQLTVERDFLKKSCEKLR
jgi:transposase